MVSSGRFGFFLIVFMTLIILSSRDQLQLNVQFDLWNFWLTLYLPLLVVTIKYDSLINYLTVSLIISIVSLIKLLRIIFWRQLLQCIWIKYRKFEIISRTWKEKLFHSFSLTNWWWIHRNFASLSLILIRKR